MDTYTVSFSNNTTTTFTVTNGSSIQSIAKTSTTGLIDTYTVTLTNGQTSTFTVTNAKSITSVTMTGGTHAAGTSDTYTISFNDGDTATFQVYNGANGTGAVSTVAGIGVEGANGNVPLILTGNGAPTTATIGQTNQLYFDTSGSVLYICLGENGGTYSWAGAGVTVDSSMSTSSTNPVQNKVISSKVGTGTLNTTATDCVGAINEHDNEIGDVSTLTTTATTLAGAINELDADIGTTALPTTAQTLTGAIAEVDGAKVSKSGDTMTGDLYVQGAAIRGQATNITDGTVVSTATNSNTGFSLKDSNDYSIGYIVPRFLTNGDQGLRIVSQRKVSGSTVQNEILMSIASNGDKKIAVTDQHAWRQALGLNYAVNDTATLSSLAINGYVPTNADRLYLGLPVPKSMEDISTVTVTGMKGALRGISGAIDGTTSSTELTTAYTVTAVKSTDNMVRIYVLKSSTMSNNVVSTPVSFAGSVTLKFT